MLHMLTNSFFRLYQPILAMVSNTGGDAPGEAPAAVYTQTTQATQAVEGATGGGGIMGGDFFVIGIWAVFLVGAWFFLMRPHRKREKKLKEMQSQIKAGDNIVTNSGLFGKITDVGTDCFIVEMGISGRTVKLPVLKSEVLGVREPVLTPPPKDSAE